MHYGQVMNIYQETLLPANGAFSITKRKYVIYRWRITLAPSYLNNQIEMETDLRIWEYNWYRMKEIMKKHHEEETLTQDEIQILGDYRSFCKPDSWRDIEQRIRTQNQPRKQRIRKNRLPYL